MRSTRRRYEAFPVYVAADGAWLAGDALRNRALYIPDEAARATLMRVDLDLSASKGILVPRGGGGLFARKPAPIEFDVALLAFHGNVGEDGAMQGVFEAANLPYTGMRTLASAVLMDKAITKRVLAGPRRVAAAGRRRRAPRDRADPGQGRARDRA